MQDCMSLLRISAEAFCLRAERSTCAAPSSTPLWHGSAAQPAPGQQVVSHVIIAMLVVATCAAPSTPDPMPPWGLELSLCEGCIVLAGVRTHRHCMRQARTHCPAPQQEITGRPWYLRCSISQSWFPMEKLDDPCQAIPGGTSPALSHQQMLPKHALQAQYKVDNCKLRCPCPTAVTACATHHTMVHCYCRWT